MEMSADVFELVALPPLSPTMERAFTEAFAAMSELEERGENTPMFKLEPSSTSHVWPPSLKDYSALSPMPVSMTSRSETHSIHMNEINNMSPSRSKQQTAKDTTEDKRARRSAIEKKSRQRRQIGLKTMRDEVQELETLLATKKETGTSMKASAIDELQRQYTELMLVTHTSEKEHETLQKLLDRYQELQRTVTSLSDQDREQRNSIWDTGVPPSLSFQARFRQLTADACCTLVRESYEEIQRFNDAEHFVSTGANFMGWTDKRKYDPVSGTLQYGFTKQFPFVNSEDLLMKTWNIFIDARKFKEVSFHRSVDFRYEVLQRVNDDLIIVRQDHRIPNMDTTFVSVRVMFRLQTSTGYTLCIRTIPSPEIQEMQEPHEYFYEVFHWTHINRIYDEFGNPAGCEMMSAGSIADQKHLKSTYWLFELVCSILRWESICVSSLFLKQT